MAIRLFLGLSTLIWLPYGIACFLNPELLADSAGLVAHTATGHTELRAMYGGLQAAVGVWAAAALFRVEWARPVLTALAVLPAGLALGRVAGAAIDGAWSTYTVGALLLEMALTLIACWLLRREG